MKFGLSFSRIAIVVGLILIVAIIIKPQILTVVRYRLQGKKTVEDRLNEYGTVARVQLKLAFDAAGIAYPPKKLVFAGIKRDRVLQVYASNGDRYV